MVYDAGKVFVNNIGRKFYKLSGIPSGSVALFTLGDLPIYLIYIFLRDWR